jgi:hypothetical protein
MSNRSQMTCDVLAWRPVRSALGSPAIPVAFQGLSYRGSGIEWIRGQNRTESSAECSESLRFGPGRSVNVMEGDVYDISARRVLANAGR